MYQSHFLLQTRSFGSITYPLTSLQCGSLLQSLTNAKSLKQGRILHAHMIIHSILHDNTYLSTKLAAFYAGCGRMVEAQSIFDSIPFKNSFLWNFMIRGYASSPNPIKSIILYREMLSFGWKADAFTYPFVIKACGDLLLADMGRRVHAGVVVSGLCCDIYVANSLLSMYSKFGDMAKARELFDRTRQRDLTTWNTMITGYAKNGDPREAILFFHSMEKLKDGIFVDETTLLGLIAACGQLSAVKCIKDMHAYSVRNGLGLCNAFVANSLIEMYGSCNSILYARRLFEVSVTDTVSWNSLLSSYVRNGDAFESLKLFCRMVVEDARPNEITLVHVLGACAQITALRFGMSVHSYLLKKAFHANSFVGTALIDMYSKCGSLVCLRLVFDELPQKNLITWSSIISGYGINGRGRDAISCFNEMVGKGIEPDEVVLSSVLSACSHAGLVDEGKNIFENMTKIFNIKPKIASVASLVDLLGRGGKLDEAYGLIKALEFEPTSDIWSALLSGCRSKRNVELAEIAAQKVFELDPHAVGAYICLSNIYAAEKRWADVERVRFLMRERGLSKPPGCSYIELDNVMYRFLVGDLSHEQSDDIYTKLRDLRQELETNGYKPDTSSVFYDVEEEAKERILWNHSEKLAIAFALINTGPGTSIRITKNLRVCGDCHTVTKLISKLTHREIIMRDIRRFHHFKDGLCSCGDFW